MLCCLAVTRLYTLLHVWYTEEQCLPHSNLHHLLSGVWVSSFSLVAVACVSVTVPVTVAAVSWWRRKETVLGGGSAAALGAIALLWWWKNRDRCEECGHACGGGWVPCRGCLLGDDPVCDQCEDLGNSPGGNRRRRRRRECLFDDLSSAFSDMSPLLVFFGLAAYKDGQLMAKALDQLRDWLRGTPGQNVGPQPGVATRLYRQFTSGQAAATGGGNGWQNAFGFFPGVDWTKVFLGAASCWTFLRWRESGKKRQQGRRSTEAKVAGSHNVTGWMRAGQATGTCRGPDGSTGTCFRAGQYVVTVGHVAQSGKVQLTFGDQTWEGKVVRYFPSGGDGVTVISPNTPIPLQGLRAAVPSGKFPGYVVAMGAGGPTISTGEVDATGAHYCTTTFGHSGSAVMTSSGVVVGVHQGGGEGENVYIPFTSDIVAFLRAPPSAQSHSVGMTAVSEGCTRDATGRGGPESSAESASDSSDEEENSTPGQTQTVLPAQSSGSTTNPQLPPSKKKAKKRKGRARGKDPLCAPSDCLADFRPGSKKGG